MRLGFAGLGRMGTRMAANAARAGFDVMVWNRSPEPAARLATEVPVGIAASLGELAARSAVIVSMLANDEAARAVHLGDGGLVASGGAECIVEMGTISPELVTGIAAEASARGKRFLDAPVSGATQAAADAQLLVMAGGREAGYPDLPPVFGAMARKVIWLGQSGQGAVMKLAVNMLIHGINQTLSEALALAGRCGIDEALAFDVVESSAAAAPMLSYRRPLYLDEAAHPVSFTVDLAAKDVGLALDLARRHGVSMPQTRATLDVLDAACRAGFSGRDMASILTFMKEARP
ncbi:NAD(P)-dependent oxidoreductase [Zhengella mangrovi]|nr:NAD(P)-dependent oxidoreductase [Zhengella mangrovi]